MGRLKVRPKGRHFIVRLHVPKLGEDAPLIETWAETPEVAARTFCAAEQRFLVKIMTKPLAPTAGVLRVAIVRGKGEGEFLHRIIEVPIVLLSNEGEHMVTLTTDVIHAQNKAKKIVPQEISRG